MQLEILLAFIREYVQVTNVCPEEALEKTKRRKRGMRQHETLVKYREWQRRNERS
jgi:hypothetical protein